MQGVKWDHKDFQDKEDEINCMIGLNILFVKQLGKIV